MDKAKEVFSQKEVNTLFGRISAKTLRWWGIMQLYGWTYEFEDGRGVHRQYERANLYQIGLVEQLSDLNIPIPVIRNTMAKHFCAGMRMSEVNQRPLVNVSTQMDKVLVIEKTFTWLLGQKPTAAEDPIMNWLSFLIENDEVPLRKGTDITMFIKLDAIKEFVDSLIRQA
jgi:hypothetical protein